MDESKSTAHFTCRPSSLLEGSGEDGERNTVDSTHNWELDVEYSYRRLKSRRNALAVLYRLCKEDKRVVSAENRPAFHIIHTSNLICTRIIRNV